MDYCFMSSTVVNLVDIVLFLQARGQWLGATFKEPLLVCSHTYPAPYTETRKSTDRQESSARRDLFAIPGLVFTDSEKKRIMNHFNKQKQMYNKKMKDANKLEESLQALTINAIVAPSMDIVSDACVLLLT